MSTLDPRRTPCIIGVARKTWHPSDLKGNDGTIAAAPEPLDMWEEVARSASKDAGAPDALKNLESIDIVYCQSWQYDDAPVRLSERLGASPSRKRYSGLGGSVPQTLAADAASLILSGDLDLGLIVGAEALATLRRLKKAGEKPSWSYKPDVRRPFPLDISFLPSEITHGVFEAYLTFAMFDNARRARLGTELDEHREALGALLSAMTSVAAKSEHAWFPTFRPSKDIWQAREDNRMVAYPYTKLMTSIMDVDMAAALLIASTEKADELGVPADKRVYLRGHGYAQDPDHVAQHRDLSRSRAMKIASEQALGCASIEIDQVKYLDLYSCFASSICFGLDALGIEVSDASGPTPKQPITLTGGLPYHGGPGSNYMTHSLAAMAETLRIDPGSFGLVSGVGMFMTKHAYGLWSTTPGQFEHDKVFDTVPPKPECLSVQDLADGEGTVATYSVIHGHDGSPESALLVCDLNSGERCYAKLSDGDALVASESDELIGQKVVLRSQDGINHASLTSY